MRPLSLAFLLALISSMPAAAEDVPRFDIRLFCSVNAGARGGQVSCQRKEEATRVAMAQRWEGFPKQRKHFCVQSVSFQPRQQRSYVDLAGCLEEAQTS